VIKKARVLRLSSVVKELILVFIFLYQGDENTSLHWTPTSRVLATDFAWKLDHKILWSRKKKNGRVAKECITTL